MTLLKKCPHPYRGVPLMCIQHNDTADVQFMKGMQDLWLLESSHFPLSNALTVIPCTFSNSDLAEFE